MIIGELGLFGRPYVRCRLLLPRIDVSGRITFLVDTGADSSYLHPHDGVGLGVPFDLLQGRSTSRGMEAPRRISRNLEYCCSRMKQRDKITDTR